MGGCRGPDRLPGVNELIDRVLPRYFRGAVILTLWAATETTLDDVARYIKVQKGIELGLEDIRGRDTLSRFAKYFEHVLQYPLDVRAPAWSRLRDVQALRNCIAHSNGRLSRMRPPSQKRIREIAQRLKGVNLDTDRLRLSKEFTEESNHLVAEWLSSLTGSIRKDFSTDLLFGLFKD